MNAWVTTYRSGTRVAEVHPGESHSDAWVYVTTLARPTAAYRDGKPCRASSGKRQSRVAHVQCAHRRQRVMRV